MLQNLCDLDFCLSGSLNIKCDGAVGLLVCGFLLAFNGILRPNSAPLRDISLGNLSDFDIDLHSHSRKM